MRARTCTHTHAHAHTHTCTYAHTHTHTHARTHTPMHTLTYAHMYSRTHTLQAQKNGYGGPTLGPKEAEPNPREFDEQTLQEGKAHIGLQMGTNKGASQSGMSPYGFQRQVYDSRPQ